MSRSQPVRTDWSFAEVRALFDRPLMELVRCASQVHSSYQDPSEIQVNQLISIKTGGCPEDCAYCSQSARYDTGIKPSRLMDRAQVLAIAERAQANGVTRLCMGAAWRQARDGAQFDQVLDLVRSVTDLGLEVCCTLGMLTEAQAMRLAASGLHAYNHNLDTSPEHYETIITTRTYQDRLDTIAHLRATDISLCCGGIIGIGETLRDRASLLHTLATLDPHPESVPVNVLAKVAGTPMADQPAVPIWDTVRVIAAARILMPTSIVRLAAGRHHMSFSDQALCFMAGANSIFTSDAGSMLTQAVPCHEYAADHELLDTLGLRPRPSRG